ncbi:WXG100 family type VII secretion target [Streptomyces sp. NPDC001380]|uniref:WXG100 family type VII secretion target n=1 Tax=Streptomyces sp. NPDC001380 TaxID=3364566 RepID=UPI00368B3A7B
MSGRIVVDEANLRAQGRALEDVGRDFRQAADTLRSRLRSLEGGQEPPWGDDDLGEKFGVVYEGLRDGMEESMDSLAERLGETGRKLQAMADNHAAHEADEAGRLAALRGRAEELGGEVGRLHHPAF